MPFKDCEWCKLPKGAMYYNLDEDLDKMILTMVYKCSTCGHTTHYIFDKPRAVITKEGRPDLKGELNGKRQHK